MLCLELLQALHQGFDAVLGHGVVDGGAQAADGLVALQVLEAGLLGVGDDLGVQIGVAGDEGDVHQGAVLLADGADEHLGLIQEVIEDLGLLDVDLLHGLQAADGLQVLDI